MMSMNVPSNTPPNVCGVERVGAGRSRSDISISGDVLGKLEERSLEFLGCYELALGNDVKRASQNTRKAFTH